MMVRGAGYYNEVGASSEGGGSKSITENELTPLVGNIVIMWD
jgi:hypothetical protein